ncbi:hypothetical protein ACNHUJ_002741 [Vibrio vulnificus]
MTGIKGNRDEDREFERDNTSVKLKPESKQSTAEVIDIHTAYNSESIESPSLDEFLGDDDDYNSPSGYYPISFILMRSHRITP